MPGEAEIGAFYPDAYWWHSKDRSDGTVPRALRQLERVYREFMCRGHVRFLKCCARGRATARPRLLDIGCGSGTFLALAREAGFEVFGMDISPAAAEIARREYGLEVKQGAVGSSAWDGMAFDFVTMFHVLEHVVQPGLALEYAHGLLTPGGSVVVQVPNVESVQAGVFGTRWYGLDVPRHLINFTPAALLLLLQRAGFDVARRAAFSLRDNPASIASSLAPALDPIGRRGRGKGGGITGAAAELVYFALFLVSVLPAWLESAAGRGGTIWVEAKKPATPPSSGLG